jgi:hypothetical protein
MLYSESFGSTPDFTLDNCNMITTNFTKLLDIDVPLVVAPMIGSTGGALAGAAACSGLAWS